ncbi:unnamed protein product [Danaus chrysippus]|uniref:(African queen) hypothetical protein n=1 Tax=Danaus chrysippus TaxID=151541 RepID=A0A8J2R5G1_9NEOP|nr:unnamed protein product [Danaus chrysippus]
MAKRKAAVNDIIFELDNDDIVISSDEESKVSKMGRFDGENTQNLVKKKLNTEEIISDVISLDSPHEPERNIPSTNKTENGGKNKTEVTSKQNNSKQNDISQNNEVIDITDENRKSCTSTIILNEDIVIDSPASNIDLGVVGCENRAPLVSIRFNDSRTARNYKKVIKEFIVNLLKSKNVSDTDSETDNDLEIWPEDIAEEEFKLKESSVEDNLFFVDTTPCKYGNKDIPIYKATKIISNDTEKETTSQPIKRVFSCFNCGDSHLLRDCPLPRNNSKINEKRKAFTPKGRYHVENEQKYGHLIPGRISADLRHALGLKRYELPLHIYRMRLLGYPPGWLEDARISHSGITLFDSTGRATLGPDDEEGELYEPGSKDKFDIKKILDFPGFNVAASSRYIEEAHLFGLPPMSEQDSKIAMLKILAPNAMKAYKRKKLSFFPSALRNNSQDDQVEMELDSGDEVADFPLIPPLPDDEPPPLPPPPPPQDTTQEDQPKETIETSKEIESNKNQDNIEKTSETDIDKKELATTNNQSNDNEVIEVVRVNDIPIPEDDLIVIDDDDKSSLSSDRNSPSLADLEKRKQKLLDALKGDSISMTEVSVESIDTCDTTEEKNNESNKCEGDNITVSTEDSSCDAVQNKPLNEESAKDSDKVASTMKTGQIKNTHYGTPVINVASPYQKLPSDVNFAKDICDVINFENLPNSVGKYKKICTLLKKVKSEVDRIQES